MTIRLLLAFLHLLTLCVGFYAIWARANALRTLKDKTDLAAVFQADALWGIAAIFWLLTGFLRVYGGFEKGTGYYLHSTVFFIKMFLFILVFFLELKPMITMIGWRRKEKKGEDIDFSQARFFSLLSYLELILLPFIVLCAVALARGFWF